MVKIIKEEEEEEADTKGSQVDTRTAPETIKEEVTKGRVVVEVKLV